MNQWPERAPAVAEQGVLPLQGTIEAEYQAWLRTPSGQEAYRWMRARAVQMHNHGDQRLSAKYLVEEMRRDLHVKCNNDHTPLIARSIEADIPALKGKFRHRHRVAL